MSLINGLEHYFDDGPLKDCSSEQLVVFSQKVYNRYMCNAAYEDALGHAERDPAIYGPAAEAYTLKRRVGVHGIG